MLAERMADEVISFFLPSEQGFGPLETQSRLFRLWRRLAHLAARPFIAARAQTWLAKLPSVMPSAAHLERLNADGKRRSQLSLSDWRRQRDWVLMTNHSRLYFQIICTVANNERKFLRDFIIGLRTQSYPFFTVSMREREPFSAASRQYLRRLMRQDARLRWRREALATLGKRPAGTVIIFLSARALLDPDALYQFARLLADPSQVNYLSAKSAQGQVRLIALRDDFWPMVQPLLAQQADWLTHETDACLLAQTHQAGEVSHLLSRCAGAQLVYPSNFEEVSHWYQAKRRLCHCWAAYRGLGMNHQTLGELPPVIPGEDYWHWLSDSPWDDYAAWLAASPERLNGARWLRQRQAAIDSSATPLFSIIVPVFNTEPGQLRDCVFSVRCQSYPYWQLWLIDDASDSLATRKALKNLCRQDVRIHCLRNQHNAGISQSSNRALQAADGEFVVFLDHDDLLSADALARMAQAIAEHPQADFLYSDRDMLSPQGLRYMHLMKPQWSPETLLSGNYLFHLCVYRTRLVAELGYLRSEYDGSQDYDLALRAAEKAREIQHVAAVLYHWRQHQGSVSMAHNCKDYAYQAGMAALRDTLRRRGIAGEVSEIEALWRGNYRLRLQRPPAAQVAHLPMHDQDVAALDAAIQGLEGKPAYLVITGPGVRIAADDAIAELASWLAVDGVGCATGKLLDENDHLLHAGLVLRPDGQPFAPYAGYPESEPGYMASTAIVRNVSVPHPWCFAIRRELWQQYVAQTAGLTGGFRLLDLTLRAAQQGWRTVYTPFARFRCSKESVDSPWSAEQRGIFAARWSEQLGGGDRYYHPALTLERTDMSLKQFVAEAADARSGGFNATA
jgi:GT2 family glycosyltransferase